MNGENERVPELLVELYALGELGPEQAREVEQRLEKEEGGLERVAAIQRSNEEILEEYPVRLMSRRIERLAELDAGLQKQKDPYASSNRRGVRLALAAALVLCGVAIGLALSSQSDRGAQATDPGNQHQGGVIEDVGWPDDDEKAFDGTEEDSERAWRNARAKKLKERLERGNEVSEDDDDMTGLVRALERKATRAKERGAVDEMVETCEAAREIDASACRWLEAHLEELDAAPVKDALGSDADEAERFQHGKSIWQDASKSVVRGDFESAIEQCTRGLAFGEKRCHRILGIAYKKQGDKEKACEHLRAIGLTSYQGLICD